MSHVGHIQLEAGTRNDKKYSLLIMYTSHKQTQIINLTDRLS